MTDEKKIIIPGKEEISDMHANLALPKHVELDKTQERDFTLTEEFPEEVGSTSAVNMLFLIHKFLYQMSRIWKNRWMLTHNRLLSLERQIKLLKRKERNDSGTQRTKKDSQGRNHSVSKRNRSLERSKSTH